METSQEQTLKRFLKFPDGFLWGAATAAHQVEGNNRNDWSIWESSPQRLAQLRGEGKNPDLYVSGLACDSFNRYVEDFDIAKQLNHNVHRFSIEWSRIEPQEGKFDHDAMQHYVDVVKTLKERGLEPMVTLWHFTNPIWLSVKGGFLNPRSPELYKRFISYVVDNLKDVVKLWITFNEATTVYAGQAYVRAIWPPQEKNWFKWYKFRRNVARAHVMAYREIKNHYRDWLEDSRQSPASNESQKLQNEQVLVGYDSPDITSHNIQHPTSDETADTITDVVQRGDVSRNVGRPSVLSSVNPPFANANVQVGSVENLNYFVSGKLLQRLGIVNLIKNQTNHWLWSHTLPYQDFLGVNYYTVHRLPGSEAVLKRIPANEVSAFHWQIHAEGLYRTLKDLKRFNKPVYITENGLPDKEDMRRQKYIPDHLRWLHRAIKDGVDVRGYLHWSLLDNFEWHKGYTQPFGLVDVDFNTLKRTIRPSALEYARIIKDNGLFSE